MKVEHEIAIAQTSILFMILVSVAPSKILMLSGFVLYVALYIRLNQVIKGELNETKSKND